MTALDPASLIMCSPQEAHRLRAPHQPKRIAEVEPRLPVLLRSAAALPLPGSLSRGPQTGDIASTLHEDTHEPCEPGPALTLETEAGTLTLGADGIARVRVREGYWVCRGDITAFLLWLNARCPAGAPLLVDKRNPYALDFSAQQAIEEHMRAPAAAILIPTLDKLPLAEYSRETYMRRVETRIFRSETHALRWLSTFLNHGPYLPAHDLIQLPEVIDLHL